MRFFCQTDWCLFGATDVSDGPFPPLSFASEDPMHPIAVAFFSRLQEALRTQRIEPGKIISARMSHGTEIVRATRDGSQLFSSVDGFVTSESGLLLAVTGADCAPIFVRDEKTHTIGLAHSGRKGTQANIAANLVHRMTQEFGSDSKDLSAMIGPRICVEHYDVSEEVAKMFPPQFVQGRNLDLPGMIANELRETGISAERITDTHECTFEHEDRWFSWRRDAKDGRPLSEIRLQVFFAIIR